ncbi:hypothetical protein [Paenibacillus bovis]|uniref:Uncharacterized protein n=1 Tax=Paenibacillus bovis TaxID=1616788 RepID=A0A1X9T4L5_9BACL|nr:hypothetical protein [Paenibacillus bovis]ARR10772.1 hypothetical protein AR543_p0164 [Paenibacillus bovis]
MSTSFPGIGIVVATPLDTLTTINSHYIGFEDRDVFNAEDGDGHKSERLFWIKNIDSKQMLLKIGESNFFSLQRVFLSYYEASTKLGHFWAHQIPENIKNNTDHITMHEIAGELDNHIIDLHDSGALTYAKYIYTGTEKKFMEPNPFQEYLWATHTTELLQSFQVNAFTHPIIEERSMFISSYLFKGAMVKKEISAVLYELASLQSYTQGDFIKKISNILEIIEKDFKRNKEQYLQLSDSPEGPEVNRLVNLLINEVSKAKRQYFYGIFNAADLLGPYSRHGSDEIQKINGINTKTNLSYTQILDDWKKNNLLPSDENFMKVFNIWYFTTIYLALNWLRLPHFDRRL